VTSAAGSSAAAGVAYGIDIGGTKVLGVALGGPGQVLVEARVSTPTGPAHGDAVGRGVALAVADVVAQLDAAPEVRAAQVESPGPAGEPAGGPPIGIGVPGMVDRAGRLRFSPNLPQAHGVDWHVLLSEQMPQRRFLIENDANLAALAEHRLGAARGFDHVLTVTLGTGIGGALIVDGRLRVGGHGYAGEIGHMVVDPAGPPCPCGRRGCWERYASGGGLGLLAREAAMAGRLPAVVAVAGGDPESVRGEDVTAAALAGDSDAGRVVEEVGWWVGFGLANLACVLDPQRIVLGGGLVAAGQLWLEATRAAYAELVEGGPAREPVDIVPAALGERAGAVGAALAARQGGVW
jgi:glucokinase